MLEMEALQCERSLLKVTSQPESLMMGVVVISG